MVLWFFASAVNCLILKPNSTPLCKGQSDTGKGGMFGYSISVSSGSGPYTWMAVGKPWDSSVHVYVTQNPDLSSIYNYFDSLNGTVNATFQIPNPTDWIPVNILSDTDNGTYPLRAYSLFGYSVSLSEDGAWLAIGIPGRTYANIKKSISLDQHSYAGAVRVYRRNDSNGISPSNQYVYFGEIANPNANSTSFWDKFGNNVQVKTTNLKFSMDKTGYNMESRNSNTFIFIAASGGWDGASVKFNQAVPGNPQWPIGPTTDVSRSGIYVYQITDPTIMNPPLSLQTNLVQFIQFLPLISEIPLGTIGIHFSFYEKPIANTTESVLMMLMRDFILPSDILGSNIYENSCPTKNCSYLNYIDSNGNPVQINATGTVVEYIQDPITYLFSRTNDDLTALNFKPYSLQQGIFVEQIVNAGYGVSEWQRESWFGASIATTFDVKFQRMIASIGAPRSASGLYTYFKDEQDSWQNGQYVLNNQYYSKSSFGLKSTFSKDGRFLIVSDPVGSSSRKGHGQVFLYHRRSNTEYLIPAELNNVPVASLPLQNETNIELPPYYFDLIAELAIDDWDTNAIDKFFSDHYGSSISNNPFFIIVGAPVGDCVYTFNQPLAMDIPLVSPVIPPRPAMKTFTPVPTLAPIVPNIPGRATPNQAWLYGLISGVATLIVILPCVWYYLKRRHRKQMIEKMNEERAMKKLVQGSLVNDVLGSADFSDGQKTRGGTLDDLSKDLSSNEALNSSKSLIK